MLSVLTWVERQRKRVMELLQFGSSWEQLTEAWRLICSIICKYCVVVQELSCFLWETVKTWSSLISLCFTAVNHQHYSSWSVVTQRQTLEKWSRNCLGFKVDSFSVFVFLFLSFAQLGFSLLGFGIIFIVSVCDPRVNDTHTTHTRLHPLHTE